jgi:fructose-1,6-bisphosphatase/inositol monophosphatase family enzyme
MGLMDQPFTEERYFADGQDAFYRGRDGHRKIFTRPCADLSQAILFTTSPHLYTGDIKTRFEAVQSRVQLARYGCDCYAFALLASGHIDLAIECGLKPYDVGGLIPLIEQAGGVVTDWNGGPAEMGGEIIAAGSAELHAQALAILKS